MRRVSHPGRQTKRNDGGEERWAQQLWAVLAKAEKGGERRRNPLGSKFEVKCKVCDDKAEAKLGMQEVPKQQGEENKARLGGTEVITVRPLEVATHMGFRIHNSPSFDLSCGIVSD